MGVIIALIVLASASGMTSSPPVAVTRATDASEGGRAVFVVRLARPSSRAVTVRYATSDGSARAGFDYARRSGTVRFKPGETTKRIAVRVLNDAEPEAAETFTVRLSRPANARLARRTARATIFPSDLPAPFTMVANLEPRENPNASGTATLTFDAENASLRSTVTLRGLGDITGRVDLHRGSAGFVGPRLASLAAPFDNGTATGTIPLSRAVMLEIRAAPSEFYVDVHTRPHPNGALRGQLRPAS